MLHREVKIINNQFQARPEICFYWKLPISILSLDDEYHEAQRIIFQQNWCIPKEIWPKQWAQWNYTDNYPHWEKV
ncbi:hypothetical protein KY289_030364 [Solanum tuberosum]|nr:hypothetical protein KY289_030364 [Solanum tuberosum]